MEVFFVIWLLFGGTAAAIAGSKGHSVVAWLLLGFLFGPFALIIIAVKPKDESRQLRAGFQSGELRNCPYCAEPIRSEASKCKHCGSSVPPPPKMDVWGRVRPEQAQD